LGPGDTGWDDAGGEDRAGVFRHRSDGFGRGRPGHGGGPAHRRHHVPAQPGGEAETPERQDPGCGQDPPADRGQPGGGGERRPGRGHPLRQPAPGGRHRARGERQTAGRHQRGGGGQRRLQPGLRAGVRHRPQLAQPHHQHPHLRQRPGGGAEHVLGLSGRHLEAWDGGLHQAFPGRWVR